MGISHNKKAFSQKMSNNSKVAVVTGGSMGLGLAAAQKLVANGYQVALLDLDLETAEQEAMTLKNNCKAWKLDVTKPELVKQVIQEVIKTYQRIDVLINCAGVVAFNNVISNKPVLFAGGNSMSTVENHSEAFLKILNINVVGTFNVLREVAKTMVGNSPEGKFNQRGVIINVGSTMGLEGENGHTFYAGTKGAVHGMTMPLARDLGKFGIRVVTVAPGPFITPMLRSGSADPRAAKLLAMHEGQAALGRLGDAEEFGDACIGIVNSTFMTGNVVRLDGGLRLPKL